ncbi:MAG: putative bifunctional diguanylate cyclase/phosphodiesterase [Cyanobacteriota bacterium]|jgi:diguanylate cyclase (GGDEF)-like protein
MSGTASPRDDADAVLIEELRSTLGRLEAALATIDDALVITTGDGRVQWCNASFEQLVSLPRLLVLDRPLDSLLPQRDDGLPLIPPGWHGQGAAAAGERFTVFLSREPMRALEIEWEPVISDPSRPLVLCFRDSTARVSYATLQEEVERSERRRLQAEVAHQQLQERQMRLAAQVVECPVTGLPNRRALHTHITRALRRLRNTHGAVTLLFCDLNGFKEINDLYGHQVGDELLIEIARRLRRALGPGDVLARLGGDEFVVLTTAEPEGEVFALAERLQQQLGEPWKVQGSVVHPSMSVGIASSSDPLLSVEELVRRADLAMYEAKTRRDRGVACYDERIDQNMRQSIELRRRLERAIEQDELVIHYQPIVNLHDGQIAGLEALVRLPGPEATLILPGDFIPLAERTGLIFSLGAWVLERVLSDLQRLATPGAGFRVSVNMSPLELRRQGFATAILERIHRHGVSPKHLAIEVTESMLITRPDRTSRELQELRRAGMQVHLDDFGSGYSSMSWLARLPIDAVKIDRSFIAEGSHDPRKARVLEAMVQLARDLDLEVVAEGIETEEQEQRMVRLGCGLGQGWRFGLPSPDILESLGKAGGDLSGSRAEQA